MTDDKMMASLIEQILDRGPSWPRGRLVMVALAAFTDREGRSSASLKQLASISAMSLRGIQTAIKRLEAEGWVRVVHGGGRLRANAYLLRIPPIADSCGTRK